MRTIVTMFDDLRDAQAALVDLHEAGIPNENTSLVARDVDEQYREYLDSEITEESAEGIAVGASLGALIGGIGGLLMSLGALAIPGVGPIVAAGPILAALTGGLTGAVAGGLVGALVEMGIPDTDAQLYAEGIRRGGTLLVVRAANHQVDTALEALHRHNPADIDRHAECWRGEGWTGYDKNCRPYTREEIEDYRRRYRAYTGTDAEGPAVAGAGVEHLTATTAGAGEPMATGADVAEPAVAGTDSWSDYEPEFRTHYQSLYAGTGRSYAYYRPAYLYGCDLASSSRYQDYSWAQVEPEARRSWEERNGVGSWEKVNDAVHTSWKRCRVA